MNYTLIKLCYYVWGLFRFFAFIIIYSTYSCNQNYRNPGIYPCESCKTKCFGVKMLLVIVNLMFLKHSHLSEICVKDMLLIIALSFQHLFDNQESSTLYVLNFTFAFQRHGELFLLVFFNLQEQYRSFFSLHEQHPVCQCFLFSSLSNIIE